VFDDISFYASVNTLYRVSK